MAPADAQSDATTTTPIKHVVVIFQENVSFDHYFATYPYATNPPGEPTFHAAPGTPSVNGLTPALLTGNPNSAQPARLDRAQAMTCDMDHDYTAEQRAANGGLMNRFVEETGASYGSCDRRLVMDYYDGNTVTGLWNYAQHFAMNDNSFGTTFGPSTPGALNLVSGQTHGATPGPHPERHGLQRPRPHLRRLLQGADGCDERAQRGRLAEREARHLGLVRGRLPADERPRRREGGVRDRAREFRQGERHRLHPAPRAIRVLSVDHEPAPPGADVRGDDR
jgi:hypothetical protein